MELWVRSQRKHDLFKADNFRIENIGDWAIISGEHGAIGQYHTYERCRDVLDEIQKILMADPVPILVFTNCDVPKDAYDGLNEMYKKGNLLALCANTSRENIKVIEKSTVVYEMPEK